MMDVTRLFKEGGKPDAPLIDQKKNDEMGFIKMMMEMWLEDFEDHILAGVRKAREFNPDVVVINELYKPMILVMHALCFPVMEVGLSAFAYMEKLKNRIEGFFMERWFRKELNGKLAHAVPECKPLLRDNFRQTAIYYGNLPSRISLAVCGPLVPKGMHPDQFKHVGHICLGNDQVGELDAKTSSDWFGTGDASSSALDAFLSAGSEPVYIGWGSMVLMSPRFMAHLAVRSLKVANLRGLVCGGWAQLSADLLKGEVDSAALAEYARENV